MKNLYMALVLSVFLGSYANAGIGIFGAYQDVSDGDPGMGGGVSYTLPVPSILENLFLEARVSYLAGFGEEDVDVTLMPIEFGAGYEYQINESTVLYGLGLIGYYIADLDADLPSGSGIYINGQQVDTGATTSYDIDDGIGFKVCTGLKYKMSDSITLFGEVGYHSLNLDTTYTVSGGRTTQIGNMTFTPYNGTTEEEADLSGIDAAVGMSVCF